MLYNSIIMLQVAFSIRYPDRRRTTNFESLREWGEWTCGGELPRPGRRRPRMSDTTGTPWERSCVHNYEKNSTNICGEECRRRAEFPITGVEQPRDFVLKDTAVLRIMTLGLNKMPSINYLNEGVLLQCLRRLWCFYGETAKRHCPHCAGFIESRCLRTY